MRTEDGYIIQKCLDGNAAAFGLLVDKYKKSIYALAYSEVHNFHDAQDITQEAFIQAYQKLRDLKRWDNFMGWLYRITINLCKNWVRSKSRRPDNEFMEDQDQQTLDNPALESYREKMAYETVHEALDSLPEMYRQVLILRYFGGMTIREISRFLGTSPSTIDRQLRRALARLREEILAMMNITYEQQELPASFTFHLVETVKHMRIKPMPRTTGLSWGLSLAAGIALIVLSLGSHLNLPDPMSGPMDSTLPGEVAVTESWEIPVDVLRIARLPAISSAHGHEDGDGSGRFGDHFQSAPALAPKGENEYVLVRAWPEELLGVRTATVSVDGSGNV